MNKPNPEPYTLHLPIAGRGPSLCGAQWFWPDGCPGSDFDRVDLVRVGVKSAEFEVDTQTGQWIAPGRLDEAMLALSHKTVILNVSGSRPGWNSHAYANGYPDNPGALTRFANLCGWLAARYKPRWTEVWNEGNILDGNGYFDPKSGDLLDWFGALGQDTADGGGGRYARMLDEVYRAVAGRSLILAGALAGADQSELNPSHRFAQGFMDAGGRFDGLSIHFYGHYTYTPAEEVEKLCRKIEYYQALVPGKQVVISETACLRPEGWPHSSEFTSWRDEYACGVRDVILVSGTPTIWYGGQNWRGSVIQGTPTWKKWTR